MESLSVTVTVDTLDTRVGRGLQNESTAKVRDLILESSTLWKFGGAWHEPSAIRRRVARARVAQRTCSSHTADSKSEILCVCLVIKNVCFEII